MVVDLLAGDADPGGEGGGRAGLGELGQQPGPHRVERHDRSRGVFDHLDVMHGTESPPDKKSCQDRVWNAEPMVAVPDDLDLTATEARVLGALLEKELTTPESYPLTLNTLTAACNQTSSRDPVVRYESQLVETTMLVLKAKGLARVVHPGSGERATKYRQVADEALKLEAAERAVASVLLLRGPRPSRS